MANIKNLSASSSFSSTNSYSSASSSTSIKDTFQTTHHNNQKRVVVILNNENAKKFKDTRIKPKTNIYRHSMSFPTSAFQPHQFNAKMTENNCVKRTSPVNYNSLASADEMNDNSMSSHSNTDSEQITAGVVRNLRKKFLPNSQESMPQQPIYNVVTRNRSKSELVTNFQLKKCHSVILNLENIKPECLDRNKRDNEKFMYTSNITLKKTRSNNFLNESENCESTIKNEKNSLKCEAKDQINELSVFENVRIKDKINKFSHNNKSNEYTMTQRSKILSNLRHPSHNPMKYGGSCNNISQASFSTSPPLRTTIDLNQRWVGLPNSDSNQLNNTNRSDVDNSDSTNHPYSSSNTNTKSSICDTSDSASNDESCISEDLTSSSLSDTNTMNNNLIVHNVHVDDKTSNLQRYRSELSIEQHKKLINKNNSIEYLNAYEKNFRKNKTEVEISNKSNNKPNLLQNLNVTNINIIKPQFKRFESVSSSDRKKLMDVLKFNPIKFDEDYKKIKEAFDDLKKDNELIENLLTDMRSKVKETSVSFVDNFLAQNNDDYVHGLVEQDPNIYLKNTTTNSMDYNSETENQSIEETQENFVNTKHIKFEKNVNSSNNSKIIVKSPVKNMFTTQLMPNDNNVQLIRHKF